MVYLILTSDRSTVMDSLLKILAAMEKLMGTFSKDVLFVALTYLRIYWDLGIFCVP